ncbi:MAG: squalene synthase HpnC [Planctomycetota bacterium]
MQIRLKTGVPASPNTVRMSPDSEKMMTTNELQHPELPSCLSDSLAGFGVDSSEFEGLSYERAHAYCRYLSENHYENFHVGTWLFPKDAREHAYNVYAYCRWSDDLADETGSTEQSLALLAWWREELNRCFVGKASHPVFIALKKTADTCGLEAKPFHDLLDAFEQDQRIFRYQTYDEVLDYCTKSADPVGRIVLALLGYTDDERRALSDKTCTALQLANFWQDIENDLRRGRIYLPLEDMARFHVNEEDLGMPTANNEVKELLRFESERTMRLFAEGLPLRGMVKGRARFDIDLFSQGGIAILNAVKACDYDVLTRRPKVGKLSKALLLGGALIRGVLKTGKSN